MIGYLDPPLKGPGIQGPSQIEMPKCQKGKKKSGLKIKERLHLVIQQDGNLNSILNTQTCKKFYKKHDKYITRPIHNQGNLFFLSHRLTIAMVRQDSDPLQFSNFKYLLIILFILYTNLLLL